MPGQVPVLLVMDAFNGDGDGRLAGCKAFLHDDDCCAFPKEKEYLLGSSSWQVTAVAEETLEYKGVKFEGWVIRFK